jgi:hypothetical protein
MYFGMALLGKTGLMWAMMDSACELRSGSIANGHAMHIAAFTKSLTTPVHACTQIV